MSLLDGAKAKEVLDFCLSNESPELRAKVYEIIGRSGLDASDPMFLVLALTGQMRVFLEAAPLELGQLLNEWKHKSANSLSEISNAISSMRKTQIEQAEVIKENMEAVSIKCVSDIKEAGMATTSAIASANSETLERVDLVKRQNEELVETVKVLHAEINLDQQRSVENMNALIDWVRRTTDELKLTHKHVNDSFSAVSLLQNKTLWLNWSNWSFPTLALLMMGGFGFMAGGWLTSQKYNTPIEQLGRNLTAWNLDRIVKCQSDDYAECTIRIVNPNSRSEEGVE